MQANLGWRAIPIPRLSGVVLNVCRNFTRVHHCFRAIPCWLQKITICGLETITKNQDTVYWVKSFQRVVTVTGCLVSLTVPGYLSCVEQMESDQDIKGKRFVSRAWAVWLIPHACIFTCTHRALLAAVGSDRVQCSPWLEGGGTPSSANDAWNKKIDVSHIDHKSQ